MSRRLAAAGIAAVLAVSLTACGGGTDEITTKRKATAEAEQPAEQPSEAPKPAPAKIGDTITLKGMEDGEKVDVTIKKWLDPAKSKEEFYGPEDNNRWVAAQFEVVNTGSKVYADSPSNGAQVADVDGQRFGTMFGDISAGPSMTSDAKLPPGEKALGWVVFEVPKASKVASVQFGMNSGFADQTGQWTVN